MLWKAIGRIYDFSSVGMKISPESHIRLFCQISETNIERFVL